MTKKRSRSLFVVFTLLLVICLIACFVNFTYPLMVNGNYYSYSNFVSNIKLGEDVGNSLRIVYRTESPENESSTTYNDLKNSTMSELKQIVQSEGYKDVTVSQYGENCISVQIGNLLTEEDVSLIENLIGSPATIAFSKNSDGSDPFMKRECIEKVYATGVAQTQGSAEQTYYVVIDFKDEYVSKLVEISAESDIYIYLGETQFSNISKGNITNDGVISFSSDSFTSLQSATTVANQIKTGTLALELTQIDSAKITPSYGIGADVLIAICMAIFVIAVFVYLIIKYRSMGWLACFNLLFFITIGLFLLQSIPLVHVNFAGIVAMLICLLVSADSLMTIFNRAKQHYQEDTKLYVCFKLALKESWLRIIISNVLVLLVGFACLFMPNLAVQSFGWVALVLSFVTMFTSLVLMRLFINMYLALNNTNGVKCNFHKGGKNA